MSTKIGPSDSPSIASQLQPETKEPAEKQASPNDIDVKNHYYKDGIDQFRNWASGVSEQQKQPELPGEISKQDIYKKSIDKLQQSIFGTTDGGIPKAIGQMQTQQTDIDPLSKYDSGKKVSEFQNQLAEGATKDSLAKKFQFAGVRGGDSAEARKTFNKEISEPLKQDGKGFVNAEDASKFVNQAVADPAKFDRIVKEGNKETKKLFTHAVLSDPKLSDQQKTNMLQRLTANKKGQDALTLDDVVKSAPDSGMKGITKLMSLPQNPNLAGEIAKTSPESQLRAAKFVLANKDLTPTERSDALHELFANTGKSGLNYMVSRSTPDEQKSFAKVFAGSEPLQQRVGRDLIPANQQRIVTNLLNLPIQQGVTGGAISNIMANMRASDKNALIRQVSDSGQLDSFLRTQNKTPIEKGLLPGINSTNAALVKKGFESLAARVKEDPSLVDPNSVGVKSSVSTAGQIQVQHQTQKGTETSTEIGADVSLKIVSGSLKKGSKDSEQTQVSTGGGVTSTSSLDTDHHQRAVSEAERKRYNIKNPLEDNARRVDRWVSGQPKKYRDDYINTRDNLLK